MQNKDSTQFPELLSGQEARELIGITWPVWEALLEGGELPKPVDVANRIKWRRDDLIEWVKSRDAKDLSK